MSGPFDRRGTSQVLILIGVIPIELTGAKIFSTLGRSSVLTVDTTL